MKNSLMISFDNYSYKILFETLDILSDKERQYLLSYQKDFYKDLFSKYYDFTKFPILLTLESNRIIEDKIKSIIDGHCEDNINDSETIRDNEDPKLILNLKSIAKELKGSDNFENINNLKTFLITLSDVVQRYGFISIDFNLLRDNTIKENNLFDILLMFSMGFGIQRIKNILSNALGSKLETKYFSILLRGMKLIEDGNNPDKIMNLLSKTIK